MSRNANSGSSPAWSWIPLLLVALIISSCGSGGGEANQSNGEAKLSEREPARPISAVPGSESATDGTGAEAENGQVTRNDFDRKVIKTADLGIRSEDVRRSATKAQQIATDFGGSVQSSRIDQGNGPVSAELAFNIPSQEFNATLEELRGLGKNITADAVSGKDVTEEFVDLKSRERNLLAAEQSLLKLYNESDDVNDSLSIQREITDVRGRMCEDGSNKSRDA